MLLFLSFLILDFVTAKIYARKPFRCIESEFENFKLAAIKDDFIRKAVESSQSDETTGNVFNELLQAANVSEFIDTSEKYRIPIQRLLYEWNYVPAEDSPKHILNVLNNDCIQEILRKLTETSDFISAAEICHSFQVNALQCYPLHFGDLSLSFENKIVGRYCGLSLEHAPNFLKIFGHLIKSVELISVFDCGTLRMIAENCGDTLHHMDIKGHGNTAGNFNELSQLKALSSVRINSISIDYVELPDNLEYILFYNVKVQTDMQCIAKKFPKLNAANFTVIDNLSDTVFKTFISLNPQIEYLTVLGCYKVSNSTIASICNYLPNLVDLGINCITMTTHEYNEMAMHLSHLQQLKHLHISLLHIPPFEFLYPAMILIDSLVANIPRIESLRLFGVHDIDETLPGLLQLLHLKVLVLACIGDDIFANTILELVKTLPVLEEIRFTSDTISISEIMNILEYSENLTKLEISILELDMDLSTYNSILALIKGRLEVEIRICYGNIDENIFQRNVQRLKIVKIHF